MVSRWIRIWLGSRSRSSVVSGSIYGSKVRFGSLLTSSVRYGSIYRSKVRFGSLLRSRDQCPLKMKSRKSMKVKNLNPDQEQELDPNSYKSNDMIRIISWSEPGLYPYLVQRSDPNPIIPFTSRIRIPCKSIAGSGSTSTLRSEPDQDQEPDPQHWSLGKNNQNNWMGTQKKILLSYTGCHIIFFRLIMSAINH